MIMGDIKTIFHQIKVLEKDTDSLRFLWGANPSLPINQYIVQVHSSTLLCQLDFEKWSIRQWT